jgi:hypothetical protein
MDEKPEFMGARCGIHLIFLEIVSLGPASHGTVPDPTTVQPSSECRKRTDPQNQSAGTRQIKTLSEIKTFPVAKAGRPDPTGLHVKGKSHCPATGRAGVVGLEGGMNWDRCRTHGGMSVSLFGCE